MCTYSDGSQESYEHVAACMSQDWPCLTPAETEYVSDSDLIAADKMYGQLVAGTFYDRQARAEALMRPNTEPTIDGACVGQLTLEKNIGTVLTIIWHGKGCQHR